MRRIRPKKPCSKCGFDMTDCVTDENDCWGVSKCKNPTCDGWRDAWDLVHMDGCQVEIL